MSGEAPKLTGDDLRGAIADAFISLKTNLRDLLAADESGASDRKSEILRLEHVGDALEGFIPAVAELIALGLSCKQIQLELDKFIATIVYSLEALRRG